MSVELSIKKDLKSFKLDIEYKGEMRRIGILGQSGSGKSLTLKAIAGIEKPDSGFIKIDGKVLFDSKNNIDIIPQKRRVGYMFQSLALFPNMSAKENIMSAIRKNSDIQINDIMEKFALISMADRLPSQMSQGQKQRVALARIIASEPDVILLDEPFSSLDACIKDEMQNVLEYMLKDFKGTLITVSHDKNEIYSMSDELIVIDDGKVCAEGDTRSIFEYPPNIISARLTGCENIAYAEYMDEHCIFISDWQSEIRFDKKIYPNIKAVGIRASGFSDKNEGGTISFDVIDPTPRRKPFYREICFKPSPNAVKRMQYNTYDTVDNIGLSKLYVAEKDILIFY